MGGKRLGGRLVTILPTMPSPLSRLAAIVRQRGGLLGAVRKAWRIYQLEGVRGVAIRVERVTKILTGTERQELAYARWLREFFPTHPEHLKELAASAADWAYLPKISVVVPVYNPKPEWLIQAIQSVQAQVYPHWELCLADDASTDPRIRQVLEKFAAQEPRIRVVFRKDNGHISAATNSAIEISTGEYIGFLDHDDLLAPDALFWIAERLQQTPRPKMLFTDEDKLNAMGERYNPYFKCDLNRELLLSQNMVTHFAVYQAQLLRALGGCRLGFEGSQDYDLTLRAIECLDAHEVAHIPRVLYHWRVHQESTASGAPVKPYALVAAQKAIQEHLLRTGERATVEIDPLAGVCRVRYALPDPPPLVSILIPTRNGLDLIRTCIQSLLEKTDYPRYEILIIDNGSDDPQALAYFDHLRADARIRVIRDDRPFNFSALNNAAARQALGEVLLLLNNDIEIIRADWLSELIAQASRPQVGAVGAKLLFPDGDVQHAGVVLGIGDCAAHVHKGWAAQEQGYFSRAALTQNFSAVTAACLAVRKSLYFQVGGLNETELTVAFNDIDFCLKLMEAGYHNVWTPHALLIHHESVSRGYETTPEKIARFRKEVAYMQQRWKRLIWQDPYYSPNLTLASVSWQMAYPSRVPLLPLPSAAAISQPEAANNSQGLRYGLVIPTKNAGDSWEKVLAGIKSQVGIDVRVLIVDSGSTDATNEITRISGFELIEISPESFGHGTTRQMAIDRLDCDVVFLLTQDAILATPHSLLQLAQAFQDPRVAVAYGRQLPLPGAKVSSRILRDFNYPMQSAKRSFEDRHQLGIRCAFNSNSFAAYRVSALKAVGGFDSQIPVGEDVMACAALLQAGHQCAYVAHSLVLHSHDYSFKEEFRRYQLIGRMHRMRRELIATFGRAEREGWRLLKREIRLTLRMAPLRLPGALLRILYRYAGYRAGLGAH